MNETYYLEQGTYSRYVTANRLAQHLLSLHEVQECDFQLAVRMYPNEIHNNLAATTKWTIQTLEKGDFTEDTVVNFLNREFTNTFGEHLGLLSEEEVRHPYDDY